MGDATVVPATLDHLMREGLDRHEAIRAIGSVLVGIFFDDPGKQVDINAEYGRQLPELTVGDRSRGARV